MKAMKRAKRAKRAVTYAALVSGAIVLASCVGGQGSEAQTAANAPGPNPQATPPAGPPERDWKKAATGHGAVGAIPPAELARLERESAPGGNLTSDAGPSSPTAPR